MAGLDPAIPLTRARLCHNIGIAGSSPAMTDGWLFSRPNRTSFTPPMLGS
jgi:hypothetical protein